MDKQTFGVIVTTRSFFPSHLVRTARELTFALLDRLGFGYVCVGEEDTAYGAIVTHREAQACAALFRQNRERISGILVILPNFGEELGVSDAIEQAGLDVPVLIQACDDDFDRLDMANRRDAFCGKISLCNNLRQRDIKYTLTAQHTCAIDSDLFADDVLRFAGICRVVTGFRGSRIAMLGARPGAFNTVRFSEKILQKHRIAVQTVDFSEIIFNALNYADPAKVEAKIGEIRNYGSIPGWISPEVLEKQAKLCLAIAEKVEELDCDASTVQCWDSVQNNYGCATCLAMSMMGEGGKPSACESDVTGAVSMLAARLASGSAPALLDWNNNLRDDRDCCIALHCSNFPKSFFATDVEIEALDVLGSTLGKENCFGAVKGQAAPGRFTFVRLTTDDAAGRLRAYVGEGQLQSEALPTKGGLANVRVDNLQGLLKYICQNGFEHHVCFVRGNVAGILEEALGNYLGADVYRHR
jgi:L-fucose isomerase-like protein